MAAKLGIIAGAGDLPVRLIEVCREEGREFFVIAFPGQTDPATVADVDHAWVRLGAAGTALAKLRAAAVEELVMVGAISRPSLKELRPDLKTMRFMAKLGGGALGDDGLLGNVVKALEDEGFRIRGIDELLHQLLAVPGPYGRLRPDAQAESDIRRAIVVVRALGAVDVGQAAVVQQGIVLGVEAAEGTDALLARAGTLRRDGPGGVLVKLKKPGQERRADLPTIGRSTVAGAAAAGLAGIAVEAGAALVVDAPAVTKAADEAGLFVTGITLSD
jgi:DUF1009 family protein